jgi:hypothetical protein
VCDQNCDVKSSQKLPFASRALYGRKAKTISEEEKEISLAFSIPAV